MTTSAYEARGWDGGWVHAGPHGDRGVQRRKRPEATGSSKEAVFSCSNVTSACGGTFACVTPLEGKNWGTGPFETYLHENCGLQSGYNYYKHYVSASENLQSYDYFAACPQSVIDYAVCNYGGAPVYAQPAMDWDSGYAGVKWDPCGVPVSVQLLRHASHGQRESPLELPGARGVPNSFDSTLSAAWPDSSTPMHSTAKSVDESPVVTSKSKLVAAPLRSIRPPARSAPKTSKMRAGPTSYGSPGGTMRSIARASEVPVTASSPVTYAA